MRRVRKIGPVALAVFSAGLFVLFMYDFYLAYARHIIYTARPINLAFGIRSGWISLDSHPSAFWATLSFEILAFLGLSSLVIFGFLNNRWMERRRRRRAAAPLDHVIRQTESER